jgi:hypothetical protein
MRESSEVKIGIEVEIADADESGSGRWDGVLERCIGDWRLMMSQSPMLMLRHSGSLRHFTKRGMTKVFQRNKENGIQTSHGEC